MYFPSFHIGGGNRISIIRAQRYVLRIFRTWTFGLFGRISAWGHTEGMREFERKKLIIFNQINIFQAFLGLGVALSCLIEGHRIPGASYIALMLPVFVNVMVLQLNKYHRYYPAQLSYFLLAPILTSCIYLRGLNLGFELNFILYGILSVFFLQEIGFMLFSISLSMVSYFVLSVIWNAYSFQLAVISPGIYFFIQLILITLIFYGLFLVKKENTQFQLRVLARNKKLKEKNHEIEMINLELEDKTIQLEQQTTKLQELHTLKDKLFSIIAHDLRTPIHGLRNVFTYMNNHKIAAREIKSIMPDVVNELNNTTELMDNLLQWAKTQMEGVSMHRTTIDITEMSRNILQLLRPLATNKMIKVEDRVMPGLLASADRDMIHLIFRNLVSNAIKFTPSHGHITVEAVAKEKQVEVFVRDTGIGMNAETVDRINAGTFYTSRGTNNETGTGLGLMLCRDFISRNGGELRMISQPGAGSVFSFTLMRATDTQHMKAVS